jgi:hypothetical protein
MFSSSTQSDTNRRFLFYQKLNKTEYPSIYFANLPFKVSVHMDKMSLESRSDRFRRYEQILKIGEKLIKRNSNEQVIEMHNEQKLNELSFRLRFFIASIIQTTFKDLFENCVCLPFGSSMNKFGHMNSDLDLCFAFDNKILPFLNKPKASWLNSSVNTLTKSTNNRSRSDLVKFYFLSKENNNSNENNSKAMKTIKSHPFDFIAFKMSNYLPFFVVSIVLKHARVPIIKFDFNINQQKINCDLSISDFEISYANTKLLWIYSEMDERVAPFVFLIRTWAEMSEITTKKRPTPKLTNFQLTIMCIYFLLRLNKPFILPMNSFYTSNSPQTQSNQPVKGFVKSDCLLDDDLNAETTQTNSSEQTQNYLDESISCFVLENATNFNRNREIKLSELKSVLNNANQLNLSQLFQKFLEFYADFDFVSNEISLNESKSNVQHKYANESQSIKIFIQNPFDPDKNAARNVSSSELKKFVEKCTQTKEIIDKLKDSKTGDFSFLDLFNFIITNSTKREKLKRRPFDSNSELSEKMNL